MSTQTTSRWDFFYRRERRASYLVNAEGERVSFRAYWDRVGADCFSLSLPVEASMADALNAAVAAGMSKGSFRSGCFEIQNDLGIYSSDDGNRLLGRPDRATFTTWEALEAAELAA